MKLTKAQQRVVDLLRENPKAYLVPSEHRSFQTVTDGRITRVCYEWLTKRTLDALIRLGVLIDESEKGSRYTLSPQFKKQ